MVLGEFTERFIHLDSEVYWGELVRKPNDQFMMWCALVRSCCITRRRLVAVAEQPRFELFKVLAIHRRGDHAQALDLYNGMKIKQEQCDGCSDLFFTGPILSLPFSEALSDLEDIALHASVFSSEVEKQHLLGQETKNRMRGRAVTKKTLQMKTYLRSIATTASRRRKRVKGVVFARHGLTEGTASRALQGCVVASRSSTRKKVLRRQI